MFIDKAKIELQAGNGGDGAISWRREKFIPAGGPDGGDGGSGGSIIFEADKDVRTLLDFKYRRHYKAESGQPGRGRKQFGKSAEDLVLKVPVGTIIREAQSGLAIADLREGGMSFKAVKGGLGGKGNVHFKSSTRQAPRFAKPGGRGQSLSVILELKLLADVGLVGLPNVGKSSLLSILSKAKPKIANYHFTSLSPNLGVVDLGQGNSFVIGDMPGLIEGASQGAGLGHDFLRHIERTRILAHVIDMSGVEGRDPINDYDLINSELEEYNPRLKDRVRLIVANKMDIEGAEENLEDFIRKLDDRGLKVRRKGQELGPDEEEREYIYLAETSAATTAGVRELAYQMGNYLKDTEKTDLSFDEEVVDSAQFFVHDPSITVKREGNLILVSGKPVENLAKKLIITDGASVQFFENSLEQMGVMDQIRDLEPDENDSIEIAGFEFDWL